MTRLGDLCEFRYGKSLPEQSRRQGPIPVYGSNGIVGFHDEAISRGKTVVIGRKGSVGEINLSDQSCWPIDTTYYVDRDSTEVDIGWLSRALTSLRLSSLNKAAAVPGLNRSDAYEKRLFVPPLDEQRRIAAILDKADALRQKRKRAIALLDSLTQSIFIEMFGSPDPSWSSATIDDVGINIRTGPFGSQLLHSEFVEEGIAVLGIDNAVQNTFAWAKPRFITAQKYAALKRYKVLPGDVLITIMGTIGRSAVVPADIGDAINTKHLCCITPDTRRILPEYLKATFLGHPEVLRQLGAKAKGAIMDGLNMGIIKSLRIPIPPVDLQKRFADAVTDIAVSLSTATKLQRETDSLFASLQHRAFSGQL